MSLMDVHFYIIFDNEFNIVSSSEQAKLINKESINSIIDEIKEMDGEFSTFLKPIKINDGYDNLKISVIKYDNFYYVLLDYDEDKSYEILNDIILNLGLGFIEYDPASKKLVRFTFNGNVLAMNNQIDEIIDNNIFQITNETMDDFKNGIKLFAEGKLENLVYFQSRFPDGQLHWYVLEAINGKYNEEYYYACIRNEDKFAADRIELEEMGYTDFLTGVYNKQAIAMQVRGILNDLKPDDCYFLGIIDIDFFKNINDRYGHLFGDEVLKIVSSVLKKNLSSNSKVGRIGGDEFLFIEKTNGNEEYNIKPILRNIKIDLQSVKVKNIDSFPITVTMGLVPIPKYGTDYIKLVELADKALYRGKDKGKDCHIIYDHLKHENINVNKNVPMSDNTKYKEKVSAPQMLYQCIDKLVNSINIVKTIGEVLSDVCKQFSIDRALVADEKGNIVSSYVSPQYSSIEVKNFYPMLYNEEYFQRFKSDNMMVCNFTLNDMKDIYLVPLNNEYGIRAFLQFIVYQNNIFQGFISFEDLGGKRIWQHDEMVYCNIISKTIGAFYNKLLLEQKLNKTLYFDTITGYYNAASFKERALKIDFTTKKMALIVFDLVKFTFINEKLGFDIGDKVLKLIADKLDEFVQSDELFSRLSEDKFALLLNDNEEMLNRYNNISKIIEEETSKLINKSITIIAGYCKITSNGDLEHYIDKANQARKKAKLSNTKIVSYDSMSINDDAFKKILEDNMHKALENKEFKVYLQPCFYIKTKKMCSMEALVRWEFNGELLSPGVFIPLFEKNGFVKEVDFYVYETVCWYLKHYMDLGYEVPPISVNVSRRHLEDHNFIERLNKLLSKYTLPRKLIGLELTESLFVENEKLMISFINKLSNEGYRIYMDDFGVAYSTLNLLSRLHIDVIKLDKAFIDNNMFNEKERIIIANIIRMAKELGIRVLSEGIETQLQVKELTKLKCDYAQGYWFAKPLPIEKVFDKYIEEKE